MPYPTGFQINGSDFNDVYVRAEYFTEAGLWTWGRNSYGGLGDNSTTNRSSPVQTVATGTNWKQVAGGGTHTAAIKTDGRLWTLGNNGNGQLGDNTLTAKSSPVQTIATGTDWAQVSTRGLHTLSIKTDGRLWSWGINTDGQLGDNTSAGKSSPVQTVGAAANWKLVSAGGYHTAAIKTDGTLWMWGRNDRGGLGDNSTTRKSSPVQTVSGGTDWRQVSTGGENHTAAIKTDGTLWTWGRNSYGGLGDNSTTNRSSPVQTVATGTNWKLVTCGNYHTAAIKTDGTLWTWGRNSYGQLGDNTLTAKSSPVQTVATGTNWKQVSGGGTHTAAIKTDGSLWTWGQNGVGGLGDNTTTHRSSPVQTVSGGTNWKFVAGGGLHTLTIRDQW